MFRGTEVSCKRSGVKICIENSHYQRLFLTKSKILDSDELLVFSGPALYLRYLPDE